MVLGTNTGGLAALAVGIGIGACGITCYITGSWGWGLVSGNKKEKVDTRMVGRTCNR